MKVEYIKIYWTQFREKFIAVKSREKKKAQINVPSLQCKKLLKEDQIEFKAKRRK